MTDAVADIKDRGAVRGRKLANARVECLRLRRVRRRVMIERKEHSGRIEQGRAAHLLEVIDSHRTGAVSANHTVDIANHDVARTNVTVAVRRDDLLADGHAGTFN